MVRRSDLQGALHNHTSASDGRNTLAEMKAAAEEQGLSWLGISEHSQTASYAGGLTVERLRAQVKAIAALNAQGGCELLTGVESDILQDGSLDYAAEVLDELDVVVASVHNRHGQGGAAMTERMLRAARHPSTTLFGHPTGRLLLGRPPPEVDMAALLDACAEAGTAIELNASAHRLDLSARHLAMARARGVTIIINPDAHSIRELANLEFGVSIARRAGLGPDDVLNSRSIDEVRAWLAR
ncbi:MAG: PHP domain-containing protein [Proteobacteria bacterium]|nr:PHP domain-containing protein [Pseudomonadota bacterium]